ncbi:MAG: hypothetical protein K9K37_07180 [Desulfocapsa sp.]|nr:hypothetical protein [Desulfocapsa sp.]
MEMGAQHWTETCGVCHTGGGSMEYDRDLNWYSASSGGGDKYVIMYAELDDPATPTVDESSYQIVKEGWMDASNKAEMDCLMCHLKGSNPGASWYDTIGCGPTNPIGPLNDPTCAGSATGYDPMMGLRTINTTLETGVGEYDMFNRNFALKQYQPGLAASMGAGAKGVYSGGKLASVDWGAAGAVTLAGSRIADTPLSENCSVCHARSDNTMGLPGMLGMKTGYGNFDLLYRPNATPAVPAGRDGNNIDLDTDNGPGASNDDFYQDFGCKTGMGKRAHKISAEGDAHGTNGRYGMTPLVPSTVDMDPLTYPNPGDPIVGKMPDIDVHNSAGMQCATCHYALGTDTAEGYVDVAAVTSHGFNYPAERVYGMDHQFSQADSFPDTKGKNNLDNGVRCEYCHMDGSHPNKGNAPIPAHLGMPQIHLEKIACSTCHIPETYSAPGRLKYRDWTAGFWHHSQKNILDWNFDLMTGSHKTVPMIRQWAVKDAIIGDGTAKIYPSLPSLLPTWYQEVPNANVVRTADDSATVCEDVDTGEFETGIDVSALTIGDPCGTNGAVALMSTTHDGGPAYGALLPSPVKTRDAALVAEYVRDNGDGAGGDGVCAPTGLPSPMMACVGGVNDGAACMDRTECTKFDIRVNGANTFPLFDGFQLADGWEIDTKAEVDAMLAAFQSGANGSEAEHTTYLNVIQANFDVTHGVVPVEWALGGSMRGGCVSCHSSKDPMIDQNPMSPTYGQPTNPNFSPNSIGFFEGYIQPIDGAAMGIGGVDPVKNWTAMFADFDCTVMCGQGSGVPMTDGQFFNPLTGEMMSGTDCAAGSVFVTNNWDMDQNGQVEIDDCAKMMQDTFDPVMGFPAGTAKMMGMNDGIAGLQGFTIKELQTHGYLECNPFGGPISASPMPDMNGNGLPDGQVNSCIPAPGLSPMFDGMMQAFGVMPTADGLATCNGGDASGNGPGLCDNGFRMNFGCFNDADCRGAMTDLDEIAHNPTGLIMSRQEVRSRNKIDLQQGYPGDNAAGPSNIRWALSTTLNPGNAAGHDAQDMNVDGKAAWDQAEFCKDFSGPNPFAPGMIACRQIPYTQSECTAYESANGPGVAAWYPPGFCSSNVSPDGQRHIMNVIPANMYLGYAPAKLAALMTPIDGSAYRASIHEEHVTGQGMSCSDCHYAGMSDSDTVVAADYAVVPDVSQASLFNDPGVYFTYTVTPNTGTGTCATECHDGIAAAGATTADNAIARISAQHSTTENFTVQLDASSSACFNVDMATGVITQGTKGYTFSTASTAGTLTACAAPFDTDPACNSLECDTTVTGGPCDVTLDLTCSAGGVTDSVTVAITGYDIGMGTNDNPTLSAGVVGNVATVTAATLDPEVATVTILWGDYTKIDTDAASLSGGVDHTYAAPGTYTVTVTTTNDGTPNNAMYTYTLTVVIP